MTQRDESRYLPVLLRAIELGEGPPGLDRWVCQKIYKWSIEDPSLAKRLASELRTFLTHKPRPRLASKSDSQSRKVTLAGLGKDADFSQCTITDEEEK